MRRWPTTRRGWTGGQNGSSPDPREQVHITHLFDLGETFGAGVCYARLMSGHSHIDLAAIEQRLRARREELLRLTAAHEDESDPVEVDQSSVGRLSRMDALQSQAMAAEVERRRELEVARIESALERIEQGEYGYCVSCGEPIAPKRLELDPATPVCLSCAERSG
jgi:DnaK suppressor protein